MKRVFYAVGGLVLAGLAVFLARPIQTIDRLRRAELAVRGVRQVRVGTLQAYERDLCEPGKPCACVAMIHGLGDSALTWVNVMLGDKGAPAPPAGNRLYAFELPGSEGSLPPKSPDGYAVPAMAQTVVDALKPECGSWTVVGNSLGGWIAAWTALEWPEGVKRLVLVNAAGLDDPTGVLVQTARILENPTVASMRDFADRAYHKHPPAPDRAYAAIVAAIRSRPAAKIVAAFRKEDLLDARAKKIRAATVVLWGASDRVVPRAIGEGFARLIPGARLELVPDCGHLPQQECPASVSRVLWYNQP